MTVPAYQSYRDSGVDWIGWVPSGWAVEPLKASYAIVGGATPKSEVADYWDGGVPWVTPGDLSKLTTPFIGETIRTISEEGLAACAASRVPSGSVILSTRAPIGSLGITTEPTTTNQGCKALVPRRGANSSFLAYTLSAATTALNVRGKGTTFLELSGDELGRFNVPAPSIVDQATIAAFLDRETAKIDALVEAQRRLIELLKEKRQAVISHAVTKGLDPSAPMKASGIEWLGEVPAHWDVKRTRRLFTERDQRSTTGEEELLTVSHLTGVTPRSEKQVNMIEAETTEGYKLCGVGDLVINTLWGWMGAMGASPIAGLVSPAYNVYSPVTGLLPSFVDFLVRTPAFITEVTRYSKGVWSSRLRLYPDAFFQLSFPLPPLKEQVGIVSRLAELSTSFGHLERELECGLQLLLERRAALISAAVTGKIDVREGASEMVAA